MVNGFTLLAEKEEMWARMLIQVLEDNGVPCTAQPVYGVGLAARAGAQERLKVFVAEDKMEIAARLLEELFPGPK